MPHPLEEKIAALRRRVRRMAAVYGLSLVATALLGTMAALGLIDYLLRFQDRGLRIIASLLTLAAFAWTFYRHVFMALSVRIGDTDLARRIQRRFPDLDDRLQSAVEFLHAAEDDPTAGSAALRRAVVAQAAAETQRLDFAVVLDSRPTIRAGTVLAGACIAAAILVVLDPSASRIALARLVNPLGKTAWPRTTHLLVRRPVDRVARGRAFEIEVVDAQHARLPPEVRIHYRFAGPDGAATEETEHMRYADAAMVARRDNILRPFSYRVEGGDDQTMDWRQVQVVEPPAIEQVSVRLIPPSYTGWPPMPSEPHIRALVGTGAELTASATKPLQSAVLCVEGGTKLPAKLRSDGYAFTVQFPIDKSGSYWFDLTDGDGLTGGGDDRWEIQAVPDSLPTVSIERPTANLFVTSGAIVPLRVVAHDDLAVHKIALVFHRAESESKKLPSPNVKGASSEKLPSPNGRRAGGDGSDEVTLWTAANGPHPNALPTGEGTRDEDLRTVEYLWDLGPLMLKPGTQVIFYATATDYLPQTGKSDPRSLTVITTEELQDRIAGREKLIISELERALRIERGCRAQIESLLARLATLPRLTQAEVDQLQAIEHNQLEVGQVLTSRGEGVPLHVSALMADLENNRLPGDDVLRRVAALLAEIDRLSREHLPTIGRKLTAAVKTAQVDLEGQGGATRSDPQIAASLGAAGNHQEAVIRSLADLLGQLARWDSYRRYAREIDRLLRQQEDVALHTAEVGRRTLAQELRDLPPQNIADLRMLADRQLELARLLDRLLQEMDRAGGELRPDDPSAAKMVAAALERARRLAISGRMRTGGQQIEQNQIGQAAVGQKQIVRDLQEVLDMLAARQTANSNTAATGPSESGTSRTPSGAGRPKPGSADGQTSGVQSAASAPRQSAGDGSKARKFDKDELRAAIRRLWGQLPEHARGQMLQSSVEEFPPKYEVLIEEYFRRLSESEGGARNDAR